MIANLYGANEDFVARITIFTKEEGGRKTPPVNGIRWDFLFAENESSDSYHHMIWPVFFDDGGNPYPKGTPLAGTLGARMYVVARETIPTHLQGQLVEGAEFYCVEGPKKVAKGVVVKLTGITKDFRELPNTDAEV
jgi:hypothetical protein